MDREGGTERGGWREEDRDSGMEKRGRKVKERDRGRERKRGRRDQKRIKAGAREGESWQSLA